MESSQLTNFYRGDSLIQSASLRSVPPSTESHNFLTFLNLVQEGNFDILPTSWNEGIDYIGTGYTSVISSDVLNLQTSIAFKRIRTDQCNQDREYFSLIAEIRALSHPDIKRHPGILGLEGICLEVRPEDETVRPVLVFEKAKYGNLYEFMNSLKGRESSVRERLAICLDIARALTFMHSCRIIHGDIKPENVLVTEDSHGIIQVKVADFGYSSRTLRDDDLLILPWTMPWNAPEIHEYSCVFTFHEAIKTDVFSFGMLCLWLVFCDRYYTSCDSSKYVWLSDLKYKDILITTANNLISSTQELSSKECDMLQHFFCSTLVKSSAERNEELHSLSDLLKAETPLSRDTLSDLDPWIQPIPSPGSFFKIQDDLLYLICIDYRVRKFILGCLLNEAQEDPSHNLVEDVAWQLAFCYSIGFGTPMNKQVAIEWLKKTLKTETDLEFMIQTAAFTQKVMRNPKTSLLIQAGYLHQIDLIALYSKNQSLGEAENEYRRELADMDQSFGSPVIISQLAIILARILVAQKKLDEAERLWLLILQRVGSSQIFRRHTSVGSQFTIHGQILAPDDEINLVLGDLAVVYWRQGRYQHAELLCRKVMEDLKEKQSIDHPQYLAITTILAHVLQSEEKFEDAERLHRECLQHKELLLGSNHPATISTLREIARLMYERRDFDGAEEMFQRIKTQNKLANKTTVLEAYTLDYDLALSACARGHFKEAETKLKAIIQELKDFHGSSNEHHELLLVSLALLQISYVKLGSWQLAESSSRELLGLRMNWMGKLHPETLKGFFELVFILHEQEQFEDAERLVISWLEGINPGNINHGKPLKLMQRGAEVFRFKGFEGVAKILYGHIVATKRAYLGATDFSTLDSQHDLATILLDLDEPRQAEHEVRSALKTLEMTREHPGLEVELMNVLGAALEMQREYAKAAEVYETALGKGIALHGNESPFVYAIQANLALVFQGQGKWEDAERMQRLVGTKYQTAFGLKDRRSLYSITNLAFLLAAQDRLAESEAQYVQAIEGFTALYGRNDPVCQKVARSLAVVQKRLETESHKSSIDTVLSNRELENITG